MSLLLSRRGRWAALGAIVGALVVGGVAWADIPDSGVINGCYKTISGAVRVIDASKGAKCNASETALNWNQTGPTGPAGISLFANVDSDGTLVSGTATGASEVALGVYAVNFNQDVSNCSGVANTGRFPGSTGTVADAVVASVFTGNGVDPRTVGVHLRNAPTGLAEESAFHLMIAC